MTCFSIGPLEEVLLWHTFTLRRITVPTPEVISQKRKSFLHGFVTVDHGISFLLYIFITVVHWILLVEMGIICLSLCKRIIRMSSDLYCFVHHPLQIRDYHASDHLLGLRGSKPDISHFHFAHLQFLVPRFILAVRTLYFQSFRLWVAEVSSYIPFDTLRCVTLNMISRNEYWA